jgi:hypothetical protein
VQCRCPPLQGWYCHYPATVQDERKVPERQLL